MYENSTPESHHTEVVKPFEANRIALVIIERTQGRSGRRLQIALKKSIAQALASSLTKVTRLLNNTDQPTARELALIAQILGVPMGELIQLQEEGMRND